MAELFPSHSNKISAFTILVLPDIEENKAAIEHLRTINDEMLYPLYAALWTLESIDEEPGVSVKFKLRFVKFINDEYNKE